MGDKNFWERVKDEGKAYHSQEKWVTLEERLRVLDEEGEIGRVVLDIGSDDPLHLARILDSSKHKIIGLDIAGGDIDLEKEWGAPIKQFEYDVEKVGDQSLATKRTLVKVAKFLEVDPRTGVREQVDCLVCSDILNYIDYQRVLTELDKYIKPGAKVFIFNMGNRDFPEMKRGLVEAFSEKRPKNDKEIESFMASLGYALREADDKQYHTFLQEDAPRKIPPGNYFFIFEKNQKTAG